MMQAAVIKKFCTRKTGNWSGVPVNGREEKIRNG
jgi:hypothetical protein